MVSTGNECKWRKITSKRIALKSSEAKRILEEFEQKFPVFTADHHNKHILEEVEVENGKLFLLDSKSFAVSTASGLFPSLLNEDVLKALSSITVDMGAIPHVCNGADVMRPGIRTINGKFDSGAVLVVKDIKFGKSIGICVAEVSSETMQEMKKGKAARNVHYVGDVFWKAMKPE